MEYFAKDSVDGIYIPIENNLFDPAENLIKSKLWSGYIIVDGVQYSSGIEQKAYLDTVPQGLLEIYLNYDAEYTDIVWLDNEEYKVVATISNSDETITMEQELFFIE